MYAFGLIEVNPMVDRVFFVLFSCVFLVFKPRERRV